MSTTNDEQVALLQAEPGVSTDRAALALRLLAEYDDARAEAAKLTHHQLAVFQLLAKGFSTVEAGERLGIAQFTVRDHIRNGHKRLGFTCRAETMVLLAKAGLS